MIQAVVTVKDGLVTGFRVSGHSDFSEQGSDIVCAAVSSAAYMTANTLTEIQELPCEITERDGFMQLDLSKEAAEQAQVVLNGFLHALGNSRTPLAALAVASVVNMVLDWFFVGTCHMGINGGACATVIAQVISALISFRAVRRLNILHPERKDLRPDRRMTARLIRLGVPIAFQNVIIAVGGLILQGVVNGFGFVFMAGYNAASRLQGLVEMAGASLGNAVGTFAGQNIGAGKKDRVRKGLHSSARIGTGMALVIGGIMILFGKQILGLFIRDEQALAEQVLAFGYQFLCVMAAGLPMLYLLFVYRSTLQGLGNTFIPMISGFVELGMRVGCALLLPLMLGVWGIYTAEIAAWAGAAVLLIIGCYRELRKIQT